MNVGYSLFGANVGYFLKKHDSEWNLYAKSGVAFLDTETSNYVEQVYNVQILIGTGVQWRFDDNWFVRLDLTSYGKDAFVIGINIAGVIGGSSSK